MAIRKPGSGNRTDKRGSRYIQNIHISRDAAQSVKILILARGLPYTPETVAAWVEEQARSGWEAYDEEISAEAEHEWRAETL